MFVGERDQYHGQGIHEVILLKARELGIAGVSIFRGIEGYGATSRIHTAKVLRLSESLPVVIEIVDTVERIALIQKEIEDIFEESSCGGLITKEKVSVIKYVPGKG